MSWCMADVPCIQLEDLWFCFNLIMKTRITGMKMGKKLLTFSTADNPTAHLAGSFNYSRFTASNIIRHGAVSIDKQAPAHEAVSLMLEKHVSGLPVSDTGFWAGILTEKDLLRTLFETSYLPGIVADYMSRDVISFDVEDELSDISSNLVIRALQRVSQHPSCSSGTHS